ncbi:amino acid permease [Clostridium luticellarii]|jgi:AAT family amino acid transporter|uniref:Putative transport protein YifK n=1 Tax=Clostridium luticellarii TaxID=1691940 RepID=A0A2T0BDU4_9CLOT|nr:amino acid permease [Clostridium luticellarii]MCI1945275.1 amino acid permease [Clostridium luticellarii]MCI1969015.1 amino acid permease [Clostridium luticellarii]MCI1994608.1 amino acid permease [Clostridium luticellarii]MCI2038895.1 amino acid permease [Clostridium luticellarii]PRR82044.1 putative transport protein YifK [Clostridium luticellarii]
MSKQDALNENLERGLEERHIQLIALGGAIGVGLFLGSATAIQTAGPAILLIYTIAGLAMFIIMRALGELATSYPVSGSFSAYANEFIGPMAGYLTGWTYWFMWVVTCMAEITAVGVYVKFWIPTMPQWIPALAALVIMTCVNLIAVKAYGEFEFWFALIKVVTIIIMIGLGVLMIVFGLGNGGKPIGISNLWSHGGFFPKGVWGPMLSVVMVMFAYLGTELIGVTAGEAKNPEKTIPSAINKVFWRILVFYVGALFVIMSLYPWNSLGTIGSPFVLTFSKLGISAAAGIINFVVLTAALSSCNSGIFSTGRMLYNLSLQGTAPKIFGKLGKTHVPTAGIVISAFFLLIGVVLNYLVPGKVFTYVTSVATFGAIWVWGIILVAQMKFRKRLTSEEVKKLHFPMFGYPYLNWTTLAFLAFVVVMMFFNKDTLIALVVAPIWFALLIGCYYIFGLNKKKVVSEQLNTGKPGFKGSDSDGEILGK